MQKPLTPIPIMNYRASIRKLFETNLHGGMKLGLQNINLLCDLLGEPQSQLRFVHVAGTNGKGTVSLKIAKALQAEGHKTALYTSPHLSTFRERMQIDGKMISEVEVCDLLNQIFSLKEKHSISATFFEITTAMALRYFADQGASWAVLETGLGGRLDATNVINPELSVITSIALEHTEILGKTIEDITREKAGIIKTRRPVVIGPRVPIEVIHLIAKEKGSEIIQVHKTFENFHDENCAVAEASMKVLGLSSTAIAEGLKAAPPCRMETVRTAPTAILDVAHNPNGLSCLFNAIRKKHPFSPIHCLCGFSKNKDIAGCLKEVAVHAEAIHLVQSRNLRSAPLETLLEEAEQQGISQKVAAHPDITSAVAALLSSSGDNGSVRLVCGTFFIMAEVRRALGIQADSDPIDLN